MVSQVASTAVEREKCIRYQGGFSLYEEIPPGQLVDDAVGRPLVNSYAYQATTGQAVYTDDLPNFASE